MRSLIEKWTEENRVYRWEGERGVKDLERLCAAIGYKENGFRYGDPIHAFLADNPGAIEALVQWIEDRDDDAPEWKESLLDDLGLETETFMDDERDDVEDER
jgi:hypothetical protein